MLIRLWRINQSNYKLGKYGTAKANHQKKQTVAKTLLKSKTAKAKKLDDYKQDKPVSTDPVRIAAAERQTVFQHGRVIRLYPQISLGKSRARQTDVPQITRARVRMPERALPVSIQPASLKDKNGEEKYYYPSKREELVEDALRKFAVEGQGLFLDDAAGVTFTLHQLQQEIDEQRSQLQQRPNKDALLVCAKTNITVRAKTAARFSFPVYLKLWDCNARGLGEQRAKIKSLRAV
jgi:hypothetical protein